MYDTDITGEQRCSIRECKIYLFVNTIAKYIGIVEIEKSNIEVTWVCRRSGLIEIPYFLGFKMELDMQLESL